MTVAQPLDRFAIRRSAPAFAEGFGAESLQASVRRSAEAFALRRCEKRSKGLGYRFD